VWCWISVIPATWESDAGGWGDLGQSGLRPRPPYLKLELEACLCFPSMQEATGWSHYHRYTQIINTGNMLQCIDGKKILQGFWGDRVWIQDLSHSASLFMIFFFRDRISPTIYPWLASNPNPPDLCLLSTLGYRREPQVPGQSSFTLCLCHITVCQQWHPQG
jgi:hypothetical protein